MTDRAGGNELGRLLAVDPENLTREQLIALTRKLQAALRRDEGPRQPDPSSRRAALAVQGADFTIVFDGGSLGNPGKGYGSFQIVEPQGILASRQIQFGDGMTNNQAEFHALIAALQELLMTIGPRAVTTSIAVRGDSQLVIRGLTGEWKVKHPGLQPLHREALALLAEFGSTDIAWHPRRESVRTLGH
ncbi:MAG: ribonuclease HI family protein [Thermomicrobiales bacterium]|mgnify:CR=1 FL=1